MNRSLTALFSALEALLVVGIGIGIPLVPLTALWAFQYGLQIDWIIFWRAAVDIWLLGSGVDVTMTLNPALASGLGFADAGTPFVLTIALLGFALLTVLLGVRAGRRISDIPFRWTAVAIALIAFAALSFIVTISALWNSARASIWQGTLLPTFVFALGLVIGLAIGRGSFAATERAKPQLLRDKLLELGSPITRAVVGAALRGGTAAVALVVTVSGVIVGVLLLVHYAKIISLYESIHAGVLGGIGITIGQLAFLPNIVIWCTSWLIGPGFAIGSGSTISPLGTTLGPIPAIPLLGALPDGQSDWGFVGLLVPVIAGFATGLINRARIEQDLHSGKRLVAIIATGVLTGVFGGVIIGLLAWASAGAAGPGRLTEVGPAPILTGAWAAAELGIAALIGLLVGRRRMANS
jgi:hypothetical protein